MDGREEGGLIILPVGDAVWKEYLFERGTGPVDGEDVGHSE